MNGLVEFGPIVDYTMELDRKIMYARRGILRSGSVSLIRQLRFPSMDFEINIRLEHRIHKMNVEIVANGVINKSLLLLLCLGLVQKEYIVIPSSLQGASIRGSVHEGVGVKHFLPTESSLHLRLFLGLLVMRSKMNESETYLLLLCQRLLLLHTLQLHHQQICVILPMPITKEIARGTYDSESEYDSLSLSSESSKSPKSSSFSGSGSLRATGNSFSFSSTFSFSSSSRGYFKY